jgi:hypothetical protein
VDWWAGEGNANDAANTNNGALLGGATATATGYVGSCFSFDGTNSYVRIPDAPSLRPTNLTIEVWVNFSALNSAVSGTAPAGDQYLVFKQNSRTYQFEGYSLAKFRLANVDLFQFGVGSASGQEVFLQSVSVISTGVWYHVAAVRGSNFMQLYVNGQLESQTNVSFPQNYGSLPLLFGTSGESYWDGKLKGRLDEVSLYNRALGSNEIAALYAAGAVGKCTTNTTPPVIGLQPQSQNVVAGINVGFNLAASGTGSLAYQWQRNGTNLTDGGGISGATNANLSLLGVQTNDAAAYRCLVTNLFGAATSSVANLTVVQPVIGISGSAGAVVLVNSHSARYFEFQQRLQPYLDNFGVPYTVFDISVNPVGTNLGYYSLVIIGHSQLDANHVYLDSAAQSNLSAVVSGGTGLVSFDAALANGAGAPQYQFVQDIFGFSYNGNSNVTTVSFPPTETGAQMHYITARHQTNESITLTNRMTVPVFVAGSNAAVVAVCGGPPLVIAQKFGQGNAVQWTSSDWMSVAVLGPLSGLDDLVWRSLVWAARKPFVMRGLPNFVTMRIDDVIGPLGWAHSASDMGFKPFIAVFIGLMPQTNAVDLRGLVNSNQATACAHAFNGNLGVYFDHQNQVPYSDSALSNSFYQATQWLVTNGVTPSTIVATHDSEIGPNAFAYLTNWGVQYCPIEVIPGAEEYYATPPAPWLMAGPYRLYDTPGLGESTEPLYYADFLTVPGHPEFNGYFFNCYTEIRNVNPFTQTFADGGDWAPTTNIAASIQYGTAQLKRALDSLVLATVFSHEKYVGVIPDPAWRSILQGLTNNLASYNPRFVTLDAADQYVRATRASRLVSSAYDAYSGRVVAGFSGSTDLPTEIWTFVGQDSAISNVVGVVGAFSGGTNVAIASLPPSATPPSPVIQSIMLTNGTAVITWSAFPGLSYSLQSKGDFTDSWTNVVTGIVPTGTVVTVTNFLGTSPQSFYRVLLVP